MSMLNTLVTDAAVPEVASLEVASLEVASPEVASPEVASLEVTSPEVASPEVTSPLPQKKKKAKKSSAPAKKSSAPVKNSWSVKKTTIPKARRGLGEMVRSLADEMAALVEDKVVTSTDHHSTLVVSLPFDEALLHGEKKHLLAPFPHNSVVKNVDSKMLELGLIPGNVGYSTVVRSNVLTIRVIRPKSLIKRHPKDKGFYLSHDQCLKFSRDLSVRKKEAGRVEAERDELVAGLTGAVVRDVVAESRSARAGEYRILVTSEYSSFFKDKKFFGKLLASIRSEFKKEKELRFHWSFSLSLKENEGGEEGEWNLCLDVQKRVMDRKAEKSSGAKDTEMCWAYAEASPEDESTAEASPEDESEADVSWGDRC